METQFGLLPIVALALVSTIAAVFLKESRLQTTALLLMLAAGCIIFIRVLPDLSSLFGAFAALAENAGAKEEYVAILLKTVGLAYLAEFGAQLCRDSGQGAAALKIEFAAKIAILMLAMPVIASIISAMSGFLS